MRDIGVHQFVPMDRVIYGKSVAVAILEEAERLEARRVFLIVSIRLRTRLKRCGRHLACATQGPLMASLNIRHASKRFWRQRLLWTQGPTW